MTVDLDRLEALEKVAAAPPWTSDGYRIRAEGEILVDSKEHLADADDLDLIAAARNALPEMIARLQRLESLHGRHADGCMIFIGPSHLCNCPADKERTDLIERLRTAETLAEAALAGSNLRIKGNPVVAAYRAARKP